MDCQGTWIWLESWYRLRPYSTWYHISILDVLYVAPFHLGCYVLSSFLIRQKTHTNLLLSYHCQIVLLFCWEFLVELNAAIFMRYKINSFHYIIKASVYSIYFNVEIDTVIIFSLNQKKHRQCNFQVVNENFQWLCHVFWVFKCSYLQSAESLGAYYNNCGYLCDCQKMFVTLIWCNLHVVMSSSVLGKALKAVEAVSGDHSHSLCNTKQTKTLCIWRWW